MQFTIFASYHPIPVTLTGSIYVTVFPVLLQLCMIQLNPYVPRPQLKCYVMPSTWGHPYDFYGFHSLNLYHVIVNHFCHIWRTIVVDV